MNDFIHDEDDKVWQAEMKLTEVTEIIFVSYHQIITYEYLTLRKNLFPGVLLKPKHHYLAHSAWLLLLFGSLFKRTARVVRNFKYILHSFAMKHELLQCYLRSGADLRLDVEPSGCSTLIISNYATAIQVAIKASFDSCTHIQECAKISIKGT
ncbi:Non-structural protein NS1 [Frankliniella fusca]|uniref:Non-structural protein NS1 n=1 Tax=Frankliniella fusca TaxID=407009 RepID=A0AAE1I1H2_9NEOP|nr:Non-structural protein NS1 [Frankliniella fusca]